MGAFAELLELYPDLMEKVGFYTFFLGILLIVAVLLPLLFEKERWLVPSIALSFVLVAGMAWAFEHKGPLIPRGEKQLFKVVYRTERVEVPVEVRVEVPVEVLVPVETPRAKEPTRRPTPAPASQPRKPRPAPTVSMQPISTPIPAQPARPAPPPPKPKPIEPEPKVTPQPAAPKPTPQPVPKPTTPPPPQPAPQPAAQPPPQPTVARAEPSRPAPSPPPRRQPAPTGGRADNALVLPTGTLVIKITSTAFMTVPGKASKARMGIYIDGKYVGGRNASSMRTQPDEDGNILNATYFWKGAIIKLTNQPTGNHRISIKIKISGKGFNKSKTAWSGTVYVGENSTTTVVLQGGYGDTLQRVQ